MKLMILLENFIVSTRLVVDAGFLIIEVSGQEVVYLNQVDQMVYQGRTQTIQISTCIVGASVYQWARACPNSYENIMGNQNKSEDSKIKLPSDAMKWFLGKTLSTAVLDSGCTKKRMW